MTDERSTFETARARLEDIVVQVRRKDLSLEQSLDLLEEAVRLVNQCNDLIDQTAWRAEAEEAVPEVADVEQTQSFETGAGSAEEPVGEPLEDTVSMDATALAEGEDDSGGEPQEAPEV